MGYELVRDVRPGEVVVINEQGELHCKVCCDETFYNPCIFEYVYLCRPDSIVDGISVHRSRLNMGIKLAQKVAQTWADHDIDVIMPVPDTSRTSALAMANHLNIPFCEGLIKNRYVGRTFIMEGQEMRTKSVSKNSIRCLKSLLVKMSYWLMIPLFAAQLPKKLLN